MEYEVLELVNQEPEQYQSQYEGVPGWIGRQLARTGSRAAETVGGMPRSITDLVGALSSSTPFGSLAAPLINKGVEFGRSILPSSEDIRENIGQLAQPGYLEPQSSGEEIADTITEATTGLLLGRAKIPNMPASAKGALQSLAGVLKTTGKTAAAASSGQLGKFLSKELGAGELGQELTNIGTTLLVGAGLDTNIRNAAKEVYTIRDNAIREGDSLASRPVWDMTRKVRKKFLDTGIKGVKGKEEVRNVVSSLENSIGSNNRIKLEKLIPIKEQMNDAIRSVPDGSKAQHWIREMYNEVSDSLKDPHITGNKVFSEAQKAADQLYTHVKGAQKINDWAKDIIMSKPFLGTGTLGALYGLATNPVGTIGKLGVAGAITGGAYGALQGTHLMRSILSNESVRNEYMRMMKAAANQNTGQFIKSAERFNKITEPSYEILELV